MWKKGLDGFIEFVDAISLGSCHQLCPNSAPSLPGVDRVSLSHQRRCLKKFGESLVLGQASS
jgi:hypothetical protein